MAQRILMCSLDEVPPGTILEKRIFARRYAVINDGKKLIGIESECKHMKASLSKGKIEDGVIVCPWHGWRYDLESGACLNVPGSNLKRYDLEIVDNKVYLIIGRN